MTSTCGDSMLASLGGLAMDMGDSAFELSTNASSSDTECRLSSPSEDYIRGANVLGVSGDTSSHESLEGQEHSIVCRFWEGAMGEP